MKPSLLFPPVFRIIGLILLLPGLVFSIMFLCNPNYYGVYPRNYVSDSYIDELAVTFLVPGLVFIGFARFDNESDQITEARLSALYWSMLFNCFFFLIFLIFNWQESVLTHSAFFSLLDFILEYNLFLILILFIVRFYYLVFRLKKGKSPSSLYLLPHKPYIVIVKILVLLFVVACFLSLKFGEIDNLGQQIHKFLFALIAFCLLIWFWSQEKNEDDSVRNIRFKAMQLAVYICYGLFLILTWLVYGLNYWGVLILGFLGLLVIFFIAFYSQLQLQKRRKRLENLKLSGTKP